MLGCSRRNGEQRSQKDAAVRYCYETLDHWSSVARQAQSAPETSSQLDQGR